MKEYKSAKFKDGKLTIDGISLLIDESFDGENSCTKETIASLIDDNFEYGTDDRLCSFKIWITGGAANIKDSPSDFMNANIRVRDSKNKRIYKQMYPLTNIDSGDFWFNEETKNFIMRPIKIFKKVAKTQKNAN